MDANLFEEFRDVDDRRLRLVEDGRLRQLRGIVINGTIESHSEGSRRINNGRERFMEAF